jgi:hypothetical protein
MPKQTREAHRSSSAITEQIIPISPPISAMSEKKPARDLKSNNLSLHKKITIGENSFGQNLLA